MRGIIFRVASVDFFFTEKQKCHPHFLPNYIMLYIVHVHNIVNFQLTRLKYVITITRKSKKKGQQEILQNPKATIQHFKRKTNGKE